MVVDDNAAMIRLIGRMVAALGDVCFATTGDGALELARQSPPDLVLLDAEMPGTSGLEVCRAMKDDPLLCDVPVIFVTSHVGSSYELAGFAAGAVDFIAKPVSEPLLLARVDTHLRLKAASDQLRQLATIDALTGLPNRRRLDEHLEAAWRRAQHNQAPLSALMIDIDHFKLFNDRYGHLAGDLCLAEVARALGGTTRRSADLVARFGGEEFCCLLPNTNATGASVVAQRMLDAVAALAIPHASSPTGAYVTVSIGVACALGGGNNAGELVRRADRHLYAAKHAGRARLAAQPCHDGVAAA